ncbi:MAG TPA: zinc-ribbon domain-containing protein [Kofleriaceae bacterium]|jgi:hypothetical protein|nr:zinc-ribbon domain-containing protein [Kofleriaceae bacterium]
MRCPSCGTDNALDSRFCGGCGTRFTVSGQRVAPTQKISDDASFPQRQLGRQHAPGAGSAVPITAPGVVAPRAVPTAQFLPPGAPPAQRPLAGGSAAPSRPARAPATPRPSPRPPSPRPPSIDPSLSLPIAARRPWALIVVVLLIDLGLAAAGIWMLAHGLGDRPGPRSGARMDPRRTSPSAVDRQGRSIPPSADRAARRTFPAGAAPIPPRPS